MTTTLASPGEWEWVDPKTIVAVYELVRNLQEALESKATRSWSVEHRKAVTDRLDSVTALMRDLVRLAGYEDGGRDARHVELLRQRLELLVGDGRVVTDLPAIPDAGRNMSPRFTRFDLSHSSASKS